MCGYSVEVQCDDQQWEHHYYSKVPVEQRSRRSGSTASPEHHVNQGMLNSPSRMEWIKKVRVKLRVLSSGFESPLRA